MDPILDYVLMGVLIWIALMAGAIIVGVGLARLVFYLDEDPD